MVGVCGSMAGAVVGLAFGGAVIQGGTVSELRPGDITDEMRQAVDTARRQRLQKDLRTLAAAIRADAEEQYTSAEPGWQAGVEWTLLWIELTEGRPS